MKDDEVIALAKPYQWQGRQGMGWVFNSDKELVSFARAIADLQKGERAVICKNCGAIYWEEVSQCDCAVGVETKWEEVKVIRSPETDLDEALRRQ